MPDAGSTVPFVLVEWIVGGLVFAVLGLSTVVWKLVTRQLDHQAKMTELRTQEATRDTQEAEIIRGLMGAIKELKVAVYATRDSVLEVQRDLGK